MRVICNLRKMIAFGAGLLRHEKNVSGTKFNAKTTPLAALANKMDYPPGHLDAMLV
jgi:hypothetical protein